MAHPGGPRKTLSILSPQADVTSAGTPERIASSDLWVQSCIIQAHVTNTGYVYVGSSSVLADDSTGLALAAGASFEITSDTHRTISSRFNLYELWIDATTSGNKIVVFYTL